MAESDKGTLCIVMGGGCGQIQCAAGVLRALDQAGIKFDQYMGASAGACVTALHASGMSGDAITQLLKKTPVSDLFKFSVSGFLKSLVGKADYIYDNSGMAKILKQNVTKEAHDKVTVTVTRKDNNKCYTTPATAITTLASAAIPQVFPPVLIGKNYYVDGGVKNNIPVPKIKDIPRYKHIYMVLCPYGKETDTDSNIVKKALSAFLLTMDRQITQIYQQGWDEFPNVTVIHPAYPDTMHMLAWSQNFKLNQYAYQYTKKLLEHAK